jgi:Fe-S-cluster containining protein
MNERTNSLLKMISQDMGDMLGGSACADCDKSYCCEFQQEIGIAKEEFDEIEHLVTPQQIERAAYQLEHKQMLGGKEVYRCPFLSEKGKCEIYKDRFIVCAAYSTIGDNVACSKENKKGETAIVNPLSVFHEAAKDQELRARIEKTIVAGEPSDVLEEFAKRFNLKG